MVTITGDETIGEMIRLHPKAAGVMLRYGLHCVGCHVNQYESVKQGALGHGMPEETFKQLVNELNETLNKTIEELELTDSARQMISRYAQEDDKEGWGLRVKVAKGPESFIYDMAFEEKPHEDDKVFMFGKQTKAQLFVDKESYELLKGSEIDFVQTPEESGFRIDNPNKKTHYSSKTPA